MGDAALWYAGRCRGLGLPGEPTDAFLAPHVVLSFLLDLAHALTRSRHDQAPELVLLRQ